MKRRLAQAIESRWYGKPGWLLLLWPLSLVFRLLASLRRRLQLRRQEPLPLPVIVVGNITVGGTGKTPLLIALAKQARAAGLRAGVVSRGYGAAAARTRLVDETSVSTDVGDEPLLIYREARCPVAVGRDRVAAVRALRDQQCDLVLSDDGLQHYRLARDLELVVVDASRGFGNGLCLPCGPLREPLARLHQVDWVVRNGNHPCAQLESWSPVPMRLRPTAWVKVATGERRDLTQLDWLREPVYAVAGIGNPQRFFDTLTGLGLTLFPQPFPDHHAYSPGDFEAFTGGTVIMTAKDAVKCQPFAQADWWYLEVATELPGSFCKAFTERAQALVSARDFSSAPDRTLSP